MVRKATSISLEESELEELKADAAAYGMTLTQYFRIITKERKPPQFMQPNQQPSIPRVLTGYEEEQMERKRDEEDYHKKVKLENQVDAMIDIADTLIDTKLKDYQSKKEFEPLNNELEALRIVMNRLEKRCNDLDYRQGKTKNVCDILIEKLGGS